MEEEDGGRAPWRPTSLLVSILFLLITFPVNGQASPVLPSSSSSVVSFHHHFNDHAVLLCNLSFSTDLQILQNPEVTCQTLYTNSTQPDLEETIQKEWSFFTELGNTVYKVEANLTMSTTTSSISSLTLCFSKTCTTDSQTCLSFSPIISASSFTTAFPMDSSSESSYLANSNAEGFIFNMGSASQSSQSSYLANSNAEGFVFNMGEGESSSYLYSSNPEGFVFNFGGASSSSANQEVFETNTTITSTLT